MTFYISPAMATEKSHTPPDRCFCCSASLKDEATGPVIAYEGLTQIYMHRDCAFAMAQRIICDAWPHRRVGNELMKNDR